MPQDSRPDAAADWTPGRMAFDPPPALKSYLLEHTSGFGPVFRQLYDATEALGDPAVMVLGHEQVSFFQLMVSLTGARRVLDLGTFTGISALAFASAMDEGGQVVTVDRNRDWIDFAQPFWEAAGVAGRIDPRVGEANDVLAQLRQEDVEPFDIVFVDVDKANTAHYVDAGFELLAPDGMILVDNALWHGWVLDEKRSDPDTEGMRSFNRRIRDEPSIEISMLPLGDGLTVLRRSDFT